MSWDDIARKHDTDKATVWSGGTGHGYMRHYEQLLRHRPPQRVLELGILNGASLRTWADIWPDAEIVGVDIEVGWDVTVPWPENVIAWIGDATVADDVRLIDGPFDLIVDDADHTLMTSSAALKNFAGKLAPGGLYVIEDTWVVPNANGETTMHEAAGMLTFADLGPIGVFNSHTSTEDGHQAMVVGRNS